MALKLVIGTKSGKSYQKELTKNEAETLYSRVLGDELNGDVLGISGAKFIITGGSDSSGFPMRRDVSARRKRILISKSLGFRGKLRGKRFGGLRIKKTVAGNSVHEKIHQLNLKCVSGDDKVEKAFAPPPEEKTSDNSESESQKEN